MFRAYPQASGISALHQTQTERKILTSIKWWAPFLAGQRKIRIDAPFHMGAFFIYGPPGAPVPKRIEISSPSYVHPALNVVLEVPPYIAGSIDKGVFIVPGLHRNLRPTISVLDGNDNPIEGKLEEHSVAFIKSSSNNIIPFDVKRREKGFSFDIQGYVFNLLVGDHQNFGLVLGGFGRYYDFGRLLNASSQTNIFTEAPFVLAEPIRD